MDRTYTTAPKLFQQLYVTRTPAGQSAVTCACAFFPRMRQSTYEEFLNSVTTKCESLGFNVDPTTVTIDFELATMTAVASF